MTTARLQEGEFVCFDIGETICGYEILGEAESFGFGQAFRVRNPRHERIELLKLIDRIPGQSREASIRFLREAEVLSGLSHPHIVGLHDVAILQNHILMTLEYVEGTTLRRVIDHDRLSLDEVIRCICQILSGLEWAHKRTVVHRSVSPETILVTDSQTARLTGFSYARTPAFQAVTNKGVLIGHFLYVAPEQIDNASKVDCRADLYAVGALLYDMITGRPPFWGRDVFTVMQGHLTGRATAPTALNPRIPHELSRIVLKSLAKAPSERYQSAAEFRSALERFRAGRPFVDARGSYAERGAAI